MKFLGWGDMTIRCGFRGAFVVVPSGGRLLKSCPEASRRRLQRRLLKIPAPGRVWSARWLKKTGDVLRPGDPVAALRLGEITVELVSMGHGVLGDILATEGKAGVRLAAFGKPTVAVTRSQRTHAALATFEARHRYNVERIETLQTLLSEQQKQAETLRAEILGLRGRQNAEHLGSRHAPWSADAKFRRLKQEFSKHFHPDGLVTDDLDRKRRERVFQEFWPIVEKIERS